jgi:TM2 domain-containing membrane protein YozV
VPGGIFISEKVYDDIKNNARIKAKSLGQFDLKNIQQSVGLYAIANQGITVPEAFGSTPAAPVAKMATVQPQQQTAPAKGRKSKFVAGLLGLLFGIFGAHRFYLGQRKLGLIYLCFTMCALFLLPNILNRFIPVVAVISFIDAVLLWAMSRSDFNAKFNPPPQEVVKPLVQTIVDEQRQVKEALRVKFEELKAAGMKEYSEFDYAEAVVYLKKATEIKNDDPDVHFALACCYSVIEQPQNAFIHLDAAVAFGLKNTDLIKSHRDLAYLRMQPAFTAFAENEYRLPHHLPLPGAEPLQPFPDEESDLLDQLSKLQKLRKDGVLNEAEYQRLVATAKRSN